MFNILQDFKQSFKLFYSLFPEQLLILLLKKLRQAKFTNPRKRINKKYFYAVIKKT